MGSIRRRLLIASLLILAGFLGATAVALTRAYQTSAEAALRAQLRTEVYALLGSAELAADGGVMLPERLPQERLVAPGSGMYAEVRAASGEVLWRSPSMLGLGLELPGSLRPGRERYASLTVLGERLVVYSYGVGWEAGDRVYGFTFSVAQSLAALEAESAAFGRTLLSWLGGAAALLLAAQTLILRWGLRPLRRAAEDIAAIEAGTRDQLQGRYPSELTPLTQRVNALLRHQRAQLVRHRDALADLAHSIKTPLAVLRNAVTDAGSAEAVQRMDEIVGHQLKRAVAAGRSALMAPVPLAPLVGRVLRGLDKVYAGKGVRSHCVDPGDAVFPGDEGDLLEVFGNLLDNAYKWATTRVVVTLEGWDAVPPGARPGVRIRVQDDGPGVPAAMRQAVLERGRRGDEQVPGQGLGLAVVHDIVTAYGGQVRIAGSPLGGASVEVDLPAP